MRYLLLLSFTLFACNTSQPEVPKGPEAKPKEMQAKEAQPKAAQVKAEVFKGRVESYSRKAKTIQVKNPKSGKIVVVSFGENTQLINAEKFKDLKPPTKVKVVYRPGQPAQSIERLLVKIAPEMLYTTEQLKTLIEGKTPFTLVDARPARRYKEGHIPKSISIFADKIKENQDKLPKDKDQLLIFYCGGVTCGLSPKAAKWAKSQGYKNAKVYRDGMPGWKKAGMPAVVEPEQLKEQLGIHTVLIVVRAAELIAKGHLPGAVAFDSEQLQKLSATLASARRKRLPEIRDAKAPIIIYGAASKDPKAMKLYKTLKKWGYKRPALLCGGLEAWNKAKLPLEKGPAQSSFKYTKKVLPGSVNLEIFKAALKDKSAVIVDVRGTAEAGSGLPGALNLPLDTMEKNLDKLPKEKLFYLYCETGTRAGMAYTLLKEKGFKNARFLDDEFAQARPKAAKADTASEEDEGC